MIPPLLNLKERDASPVEIRQTANVFGNMADDYLLAIGSAKAVSEDASTGDMERKRQALLHGRKVLLALIGVAP